MDTRGTTNPSSAVLATGTDGDNATAALRAWARSLGLYGDEHLHVRPSSLGGLGVFVDASQPLGELFTQEGNGLVMAALPATAVLSAAKARESEIGKACSKVFSERVPGTFLLQLDMALGRRDPRHRFHAYLSSLPGGNQHTAKSQNKEQGDLDFPHAAAWPAHVRELLLSGTRLGALASRANALIHSRCEAYLPTLVRARSDLFERFGTVKRGETSRSSSAVGADSPTELEAQLADLTSEVLWAWGMYESRHFPAALCPADDTEEDDEEEEDEACQWGQDNDDDEEEKRRRRRPGILLPFLDLLNHHPTAHVSWTGDASNVKFWCHANQLTNTKTASPPSTSSPQWVELFNNYGGSKGAEELLLDFGFADSEALKRDTAPLWLSSPTSITPGAETLAPATTTTAGDEAKKTTAERREGPFELRLPDRRGRWEQFPEELWPALERAARIDSSSSSDSNSGKTDAVGLKRPAEAITEDLPASADALAILVKSLSSAIAPFDATSERDTRATRGLPAASHDWPDDFSYEVCNASTGQRTYSPAVRAACEYRLSQRRVLSEALQAAKSYLKKVASEVHAETREKALKVKGKEASQTPGEDAVAHTGSANGNDRTSDKDDEDSAVDAEEEDEDYGALAASVGAGQRGCYTIMMLADVMVEVQAAE